MLHLVVVLVSTSPRRHDAQLPRSGAIELLLLDFQLLHKSQTGIYPICLKLEEVESSSWLGRLGFTGKVDKLGERTANLRLARISMNSLVQTDVIGVDSGITYIYSDVADYGGVVRKSDI